MVLGVGGDVALCGDSIAVSGVLGEYETLDTGRWVVLIIGTGGKSFEVSADFRLRLAMVDAFDFFLRLAMVEAMEIVRERGKARGNAGPFDFGRTNLGRERVVSAVDGRTWAIVETEITESVAEFGLWKPSPPLPSRRRCTCEVVGSSCTRAYGCLTACETGGVVFNWKLSGWIGDAELLRILKSRM